MRKVHKLLPPEVVLIIDLSSYACTLSFFFFAYIVLKLSCKKTAHFRNVEAGAKFLVYVSSAKVHIAELWLGSRGQFLTTDWLQAPFSLLRKTELV